MNSNGLVRLIPSFTAGLALLIVAGCATAPKVDWNSRIGNYTHDQAVADFGPPDKEATTSDGKTVADWVTRRSGGSSFSIGTGFYGSHSAVGMGTTTGSGYQDRVLRLTFGKDGQLIAWSKNY